MGSEKRPIAWSDGCNLEPNSREGKGLKLTSIPAADDLIMAAQ